MSHYLEYPLRGKSGGSKLRPEGVGPGAQRQSGPAQAIRLHVEGYHGCPYFVAAAKVAQALADKGIAPECVITRAGSLHVPQWPDADRETFVDLVADEPRTEASWSRDLSEIKPVAHLGQLP